MRFFFHVAQNRLNFYHATQTSLRKEPPSDAYSHAYHNNDNFVICSTKTLVKGG